MNHRRTRSSLNNVPTDDMSNRTAPASNVAAKGHGTTRTGVKNSTSSATTASTQQSADSSEDEAESDEADGLDESRAKPIDMAPSAALEGIKIEDDAVHDAEEAHGQQAGPNSEADGDDALSTSDFDIAEDDDDYTALDMISISSGDLHVQKGESTFIEQALRGEADWVSELEHRDAALPTNIDWNDHSTYQETPRSGLYDEFTDFSGVEPASPLSHVNSSAVQPSSHAFLYKDADPSLRRPLFPLDGADNVDFFDGSSSSSSSSAASSPRSVALVPGDDSLSQSAESVTAGSQNDSDTEDEDLTAEIEERARRAELRKKKERRRKQESTPKTLKLRPKPVEASQRVSVMRAFRVDPRKPTAVTVVTDRGCFLKVLEPRDHKFKIGWVTGRMRPNPVDHTPMSTAYALAMQSSMFRMLHCPNSPSLSFQRNKRAMASGFRANLMLNSPGLLPVPAMDGLEVEFGEATDQDITDLFLDLDNKSVADCDSDYGSLPSGSTKRVAAVEEEDDSRSEASHFQTPTPLPRLDELSQKGTESSMMSSDGMDEDFADAIQTPVTPTSGRPRKRTIENVDEELQSPTKRHRSHAAAAAAAHSVAA